MQCIENLDGCLCWCTSQMNNDFDAASSAFDTKKNDSSRLFSGSVFWVTINVGVGVFCIALCAWFNGEKEKKTICKCLVLNLILITFSVWFVVVFEQKFSLDFRTFTGLRFNEHIFFGLVIIRRVRKAEKNNTKLYHLQ